jgi:ABC-type Na+ efflux pump permease subunit
MPIVRHELTLIARRQRVTAWRCAVVLALAAMAGCIYWGASHDFKTFGPKEVARVTQYVALALFGVLFMIAAAASPQVAADAIAGERERQTLTFLLLTPLSSRAIILGKLASRLVQASALLLAGVPVLFAVQFFGGVEPILVLLATAALAATVVSACSVNVLTSVYHKSTKAAAQRGGQAGAGYMFGMLLVGLALRMWPQIADFPSAASPVTVQDAYDWVNVGNPLVVGPKIGERVAAGTALADAFAPAVRDYVLFHALVAVGCCAWAIVRLRPVSAEFADGPPPPTVSKLKQPAPRPPISDRRPVTWKMLHCDQRLARTTFQRGLARVTFALSFVPLALTIGISLAISPRDLPHSVNALLRGLGTLVLCGSLVHVAGQAAAAIGRERIKQTLDELLLTDLSTTEILGQKWLGAVLGVRWVTVWLVAHWAIGIVTGALHPLAAVALAAIWAPAVVAAASIGTYCAATTASMKQANAWAGLLGFVAGLWPIVAALVLLAMVGEPRLYMVALGVMCPPVSLGVAAFSWEEWAAMGRFGGSGIPGASGFDVLAGCVAGVVLGSILNAAVGWWLWRRACARFPQMVGRE